MPNGSADRGELPRLRRASDRVLKLAQQALDRNLDLPCARAHQLGNSPLDVEGTVTSVDVPNRLIQVDGFKIDPSTSTQENVTAWVPWRDLEAIA